MCSLRPCLYFLHCRRQQALRSPDGWLRGQPGKDRPGIKLRPLDGEKAGRPDPSNQDLMGGQVHQLRFPQKVYVNRGFGWVDQNATVSPFDYHEIGDLSGLPDLLGL